MYSHPRQSATISVHPRLIRRIFFVPFVRFAVQSRRLSSRFLHANRENDCRLIEGAR